MSHGHAHGSLKAPFADIHVEEGHVRVTLLNDPTLDGVEMALYIDGSQSMSEEYEYRDMPVGHHAPPQATGGAVAAHDDDDDHDAKPAKKGLLARIFGWFKGEHHDDDEGEGEHHDEAEGDHDDDDHDGPTERTNEVERPVREMLQYLATKDRNGRLRVMYWACGNGGRELEAVGELDAREAATHAFPGPQHKGGGTCLAPALEDFVRYAEAKAREGAKRACGVFVTDGQIQDMGAVKKLSLRIAQRVSDGSLPPVHLVLVGVGEQVSETQMEEIAHVEHPGAEHLWCHRVAEEMQRMAELVSGLVDETMTVASGGTVYDARGVLVREYKNRLPAVLEFRLPKGQTSFTLEIDGKRYTQALPEGDAH